MRRVHGLSTVLRQYLRIESSSTAACSSISDTCSTLQRQGFHSGTSWRIERLHHTSCVSSALPRHHGHRAAFGNPPCMPLFSVSPFLGECSYIAQAASTHDASCPCHASFSRLQAICFVRFVVRGGLQPIMHAQTSTAAGVEGDEKNSPTSGRPQGASNGADVPSDIPAASSSMLDEDFALGEFDAEAEAIALQVQSYHHANPDLCTLCLQLKALWLLLRSSSASTRLHMTPARLPMHAMHAHMLGRL